MPGDKLPTEAALAERFGVNRHTVRHGISALVEEGLIRTRRGAGAFVASTPSDYPIGRKVSFHDNLIAAGRLPEKRVLLVEDRFATAGATQALNLQVPEGDPLLRSPSVNVDLAGNPVEYGRTWFVGDRVTLTLEV